jgi:hypothetical protein
MMAVDTPISRGAFLTSEPRSIKLFELIRMRCSDAARDWLDRILHQLQTPLDRNLFGSAYAGARRRLGNIQVDVDDEEETALRDSKLDLLNGSTLDVLCRTALLLRATECLPPEEHALFVSEVFLRGDNYERQALLGALSLLPEPERFLSTAIEACRTNNQAIFEAISCDNPYPSRQFPEPNFNQMVLKAIFIGSPLARIIGLAERINPELERMAQDYASERRAAGRPVPGDMSLIIRV